MEMTLKRYPEYKDSGHEWLGAVPAHWAVLPNRALFREIKDQNHPDAPLLSVTISRGVTPQHVLLSDSSKKDSSNIDKAKYKLVETGDIAYNKMRAWQGALGVSDYRGIVSPAYIVVRPRQQVDPTYYHYLLRTPAFVKEAESWSYGITSDMWSLRYEDFKQIYCVLPPLNEQQQIGRYLIDSERRVNRLVRTKQRVIALLIEQKQAVIQRAVVRGINPDVPLKPSGVEWLGEVPAHWEVKRLKWVTRLQRGYDLPQDQRLQGPFPVVSSGGVIDTHNEARAKGPGVVLGRYGSTDAIFYIEQDFWPHNTSLFVTNFHGNDRRWCYFLLSSISKADHAGKSAVPGIDRKDLYDIHVALPPTREQAAIVNSLEDQLSGFRRAIAQTLTEIDLIREYRTRLIADIVTGKLDVRGVAVPEMGDDETSANLDLSGDDESILEEEALADASR